MRRLVLALLLAGALAVGAFTGVAGADPGHTISTTQNIHGTWTEQGDFNPCTGNAVAPQITGNQVMHVTYFPAGDEVWATFTETGSFAFSDSGVDYSGHVTAWGGFNLNERNSTSTFTLDIKGTGSDGTAVTAHEVQHFTLNANGVVTVSFDRMTFSCG